MIFLCFVTFCLLQTTFAAKTNNNLNFDAEKQIIVIKNHGNITITKKENVEPLTTSAQKHMDLINKLLKISNQRIDNIKLKFFNDIKKDAAIIKGNYYETCNKKAKIAIDDEVNKRFNNLEKCKTSELYNIALVTICNVKEVEGFRLNAYKFRLTFKDCIKKKF
ncbi:uncharacterized protein LOC127283209 [Leptopilina boulardi]|uniref:uncharacterized protein LOC127283209 n=1 Tax=Leptopilina boulardi TaxID=63433 RepID=UPI0021F61FF7|nr:uncharacterized protein LOC127283209 [Leptopilina boulardi]